MNSEKSLRVAVIQMNSTEELDGNLSKAEALVLAAADRGARVVALPENFAFIGSDQARAKVAQDLNGSVVSCLKSIAKEKSLILLGGSFLETADAAGGGPS